jgi:hypothetical protein
MKLREVIMKTYFRFSWIALLTLSLATLSYAQEKIFLAPKTSKTIKYAPPLPCPISFSINGIELSETAVTNIYKFPQTIGDHPDDVYPYQDNWYCLNNQPNTGISIRKSTGETYTYSGQVCGCTTVSGPDGASHMAGIGGNIFGAFGYSSLSLEVGDYNIKVYNDSTIVKEFNIHVVCQDGQTLKCPLFGYPQGPAVQ